MRALVTGATGFLGSRLAARLTSGGWEVHAVVRGASKTDRIAGATCHAIDQTPQALAAAVRAARPDVVFHTAAYGRIRHRPEDVEPIIDANFSFGVRLLEAMAAVDCRVLVNCATYWEYDTAGAYAPNSLYAASKRAFQDVVTYQALRAGLRAVSLVLFDVYGPADWRNRLVTQFTQAARQGTSLPATAGEQLLDLVHVDDVADGLIAAAGLARAAPPAHAVYALDGGRRVTPRELARLIETVSGRPLDVRWGEVPYSDGQIFRPVETLPRLPGWQARIGLEDGLREVYRALA
jgi:nucleoside-diphosphate-sugar epimerase